MSEQRDKARGEIRFRVLTLLKDNPEYSQRDLARELGVSTGAVHYLLKALIDKGFIKLGNFTSAPDKRRYAYILTPYGINAKMALTADFLRRKRAEYVALRAEIDRLAAELDEQSGGQDTSDAQT